MNRALHLFSRIWKYNYWLAGLYFAIVVGFFDQYSILNLFQLMMANHELTAQIEHYEKLYEEDSKALDMMNNSPQAIEKVARVNLKMRNDNEDVYVVVEE